VGGSEGQGVGGSEGQGVGGSERGGGSEGQGVKVWEWEGVRDKEGEMERENTLLLTEVGIFKISFRVLNTHFYNNKGYTFLD
jgi:hypothetical protein